MENGRKRGQQLEPSLQVSAPPENFRMPEDRSRYTITFMLTVSESSTSGEVFSNLSGARFGSVGRQWIPRGFLHESMWFQEGPLPPGREPT